jgi:hypothetical protein
MKEDPMNHDDFTHLDWMPVLLVKVTHVPFLEPSFGLSVKRVYLAEHPDGIIRADWTLPADERFYPLVQLVGWKPKRDVPFNPPIKFHRQGDPRVISLIPSGTWVLPYIEEQYQLYEQLQTMLGMMLNTLKQVDKAPLDSYTFEEITRWFV